MLSSPVDSGSGLRAFQYMSLRMRADGSSRCGAFPRSSLSSIGSKLNSVRRVERVTTVLGWNGSTVASAVMSSSVSAQPPPSRREKRCVMRIRSTKLMSLFFGMLRMQLFT